LFLPNATNTEFFDEGPGAAFRNIMICLTEGLFLEIKILQSTLRDNFGNYTLVEAYMKTSRVLNISVSPPVDQDNKVIPRILN
jgi:acetamidase/formamidase